MPYRIDLARPPADALDRLVRLGALDVDRTEAGVAAILPDHVSRDEAASVLGVARLTVSAAVGRDDDSVWVLAPRAVRVGPLVIAPAGVDAAADAVRLVDAPAFGTGLHPTTALCLEALADEITGASPAVVLDVGTGSGILAIAALRLGAGTAIGLDTDAAALATAEANARLNGVASRLRLVHGGPEACTDVVPLVLANILAAPLIEMAPTLVRRLGHHGRVVLSGIAESVGAQVRETYTRLGLRLVREETRAGWMLLVLEAQW